MMSNLFALGVRRHCVVPLVGSCCELSKKEAEFVGQDKKKGSQEGHPCIGEGEDGWYMAWDQIAVPMVPGGPTLDQ